MPSWIMKSFFRRPPRMDPEAENSTDAGDLAANDDTGLRHQQAFYALYLFMGITPIVLFLIVPFVERRYNRKRQREMEQRRLTATKLAEPIREAHLRNLMEGYSMVLSNSDICDEGRDLDEEGLSPEGEGTIEVCDEKLNYESIDVSIEGDDNNTPLGDDTDIDIEMQRQKSQASEEREGEEEIALDANSLIDCDNSECNYPSFCIPIPGEKIGACQGDQDSEASEIATISRQVHSDGCVVCMNAFDVGQKVTWSSNPECPHVFHNQCLLEWFVAVGTKEWTTKAVNHFESDVETIQKEICKFPKLCPFCRRDFFLEERQQAETGENDDNENNHDDEDIDSSTNVAIHSSLQSEEDLEQQANC